MKNAIAMEVYFTLLDETEPWARVPWVEAACGVNADYAMMYTEIFRIRNKISQRLGSEDADRELEALLDCFEAIQQRICQQMFDCGVYYGQRVL